MYRTLILAVLISILSLSVHAQICAGSSLWYFVRDAKGKLISADAANLTFAQPDKVRYGGFGVTAVKADRLWRVDQFNLTPELKTFASSSKFFEAGDMCGFHGPLSITLTMGKKVMELSFDLEDMGGATASGKFAVDAIPFKAGKFKIDLTKPGTAKDAHNYYGGFYAASGWKKVS